MHQSYISPGIVDGTKVHDQAYQRMIDHRSPESTLVHDHAEATSCKEVKHWLYSKDTQTSGMFIGAAERVQPMRTMPPLDDPASPEGTDIE